MNGWMYVRRSSDAPVRIKRFQTFERMHDDRHTFLRETDGRFCDDKIFYQDQKYTVVLDGVILNLSELKQTYQRDTASGVLVEMYRQMGEGFIGELRGPFSGVFYDKAEDRSYSFANQTGDMAAYYFKNDAYYITSSDFGYIISFLRENGIPYHFHNLAARYILLFGYMIDSTTFAKEIERILPGHYMKCTGNTAVDLVYYRLQNREIPCSLGQAVELVDEGFRRAVKRCFDKDLEYGYTHHLADMSGGLDSRMTCWVARDMGYGDITNMSYSQSASDEMNMARRVAAALRNEFLHMQLDDASFVYDIDDMVRMNYGATYYSAITGGNRMLSGLNFHKFGLEHTGQLGGVVVGSWSPSRKHRLPDINSKRSSRRLSAIGVGGDILGSYENDELYVMNTRGFLGTLGSHLIRRNYTYAVAPFIDVDFLDLCFSIPLAYRAGHRLYFEWVNRKYPEAAKLPTTRKKGEATAAAALWSLMSRAAAKAKRETARMVYHAGLKQYATNPNFMNPFDYWYETMPRLRAFISDYYRENIGDLVADSGTLADVENMFQSRHAFDKLIALTVLAVNKCYFV